MSSLCFSRKFKPVNVSCQYFASGKEIQQRYLIRRTPTRVTQVVAPTLIRKYRVRVGSSFRAQVYKREK